MKNFKYLLVGFASLSLLSACSISFPSISSENDKTNDRPKEVVTVSTTPNIGAHSTLVEVIEEVKPSVVDIYASSVSFSSAGSGVIVGSSDEAYYCITNHHVIDAATHFEVVVYDNEDNSKTYDAHLIGTSIENDIAALRIETNDDLTVASFIEDSETVKVGTEVIAIGNPLGILGGTVTHGIVSSTQREVYLSELGYMDLIQTDASINSGNSGGALFNTYGQLVGIVNSGYSNSQGLNFAIPGNTARECFTSICNTYKNNGDNYGYYQGESNIGISLNIATVYSSSNSGTQLDVVYVSSCNSESDASANNIASYASYQAGRTSYFYAIEKINNKEVLGLEEAIKTLEEIRAGQEVILTCRKIASSRSFMSNQYYLTGDSFDISFTATQYIYSL